MLRKGKKGIISAKNWLQFKPYGEAVPTDAFYVRLANEVRQATSNQALNGKLISNGRSEEMPLLLCCFLAAYVEDLVSGTNLWNTFVRLHKRMYGTPLPFYGSEDYYEGEVNIQDVAFLVWYFFTLLEEGVFVTPHDAEIIGFAEKAVGVLDKSWEYAPENEFLKSFYEIDEEETDYYVVRARIRNVLNHSYLFFPDVGLDLLNDLNEALEDLEEIEDIEHAKLMLKEIEDKVTIDVHTRLLSLRGKEWLAEILGSGHPRSQDVRELSKRVSGYFFYKGQDEAHIYFEHIASGKRFDLAKESFDAYYELTDIDSISYLGMVRWRGEWWFSGIHYNIPYDAGFVAEERSSIEHRGEVAFLDNKAEHLASILDNQRQIFEALTGGSLIKFSLSGEMNGFMKEFALAYEESLGLSEAKKMDIKARARQQGIKGDGWGDTHFFKDMDPNIPGLAFFNPKGGIEFLFENNSAFPMDNNPYFDPKSSSEHLQFLLISPLASVEMIDYCLLHCKDKLPIFSSPIGTVFLEHKDFLLRFWKRGNYYPKQSLVFVDMEKG